MKNLKTLLLAFALTLAISSCSKDDEPAKKPEPVNEEEVITTVTLVYTPTTGAAVTLKSKDLDGDGPNKPVVTVSGTFALNTTYNGEISVLNESVTPTENVSTAILAEAVDHQFFYQTTGTLPMFTYTSAAESPANYDANGKPLGVKTKFVTTTAATGTLKVTLRHEGNKSAANAANGDITNATGATDFEVTFPVAVQ